MEPVAAVCWSTYDTERGFSSNGDQASLRSFIEHFKSIWRLKRYMKAISEDSISNNWRVNTTTSDGTKSSLSTPRWQRRPPYAA